MNSGNQRDPQSGATLRYPAAGGVIADSQRYRHRALARTIFQPIEPAANR